MNKKAVFIDIDGTLFDHETSEIPESAYRALAMAKENGHLLFLCTGRPRPDIGESILQLPMDGMILSCGAHVLVGGHCLYKAVFPQQELVSLLSYMEKHDIGFALEGSDRNYLSPLTFTLFHSFVSTDNKVNSEMARSIMAQSGMHPIHEMHDRDMEQILKISIFSKNREAAHAMLAALPEHLYGFLYENRDIDVLNGEISIRGINKATGMNHILAYYQIPLADTIAIGDSLNDLEMLNHAQLGIAMGNAMEQVKQQADHVSDTIGQDGFYKALQYAGIIR